MKGIVSISKKKIAGHTFFNVVLSGGVPLIINQEDIRAMARETELEVKAYLETHEGQRMVSDMLGKMERKECLEEEHKGIVIKHIVKR